MTQNLTQYLLIGRFQNHGYEYLSSIYRMKEEHDLLVSRGITPYIMPVKVLVVACLAIEEYVNMAGFRVDPEWKEFDHETESVQERITHIYKLIGQPVMLRSGIWKDVLGLFEMEKLIKEDSMGLIRYHEEEIPEIIKEAAKAYPIQFSQADCRKSYRTIANPLELQFSPGKSIAPGLARLL